MVEILLEVLFLRIGVLINIILDEDFDKFEKGLLNELIIFKMFCFFYFIS